MKRICIGILAHVDAGKTTLTEALLYRSGAIRRLGRVDHADAFLDTEALEKERGITIFSKQAILHRGELELTLLDTPGHTDFSAETERALQVLDYAVLLVSAADGVQGHTETLWKLLAHHRVPTLLFVNKMDQPGADRAGLLETLRRRLSENCIDLTDPAAAEQAALCDESLLERYLGEGCPPDTGDLAALIAQRRLFPCLFGSALRLEGVDELLETLERYALEPDWGERFGARVFKISRDERGERLTWMKITGGVLRARDVVRGPGWEEKVTQLRLYSGAKYTAPDKVSAGTVCAAAGLTRTRAGQGLGVEESWSGPELEPVLTYRVLPPDGCDDHTFLSALRLLEEEDPQLRVEWDSRSGEVRVSLMGEVQAQVLRRVLAERFGLAVTFGPGRIVYLETIAAPVIGVGHFEPLRHYAEVHLLLEPLERGSGVELATACPEDVLERSWQRLILTHLAEKQHPGVLTGAPVTDLRITLLTGRAHLKHTEGGDFRQATWRAVRQGLMAAESVLLEPWYALRLELPAQCVGRAMTDLQRMGAQLAPPEAAGENALLTGFVPAAAVGDYAAQVAAYTGGRGRLSCTVDGYRPCADAGAVIAVCGYDPDRDTDNPSSSVFCVHGGSETVPWQEAPARMHLDSGRRPEGEAAPEECVPRHSALSYEGQAALDKELEAIFERTYGPVRPRAFQSARPAARTELKPWKGLKVPAREEFLLVDGYNIIHAWSELRALAAVDLEGARQRLVHRLRNYQGWRRCKVIVVFDAYRVPGGQGSTERYGDLWVVYTREAETADMYIERTSYDLKRKDCRVRVATSDGLEQLIILGHGAIRVSAPELEQELERTEGEIRAVIDGK